MRLPPVALRLAWIALQVSHLILRPLTCGVRVVIIRDRRVLLIRHSYIEGWHLPGGGVKRRESLAEAARREVREEVGLDVSLPPQPAGIYANFVWGASDHIALFVAEDSTGEPAVDNNEVVEAGFFPLDCLPPETTPATRRRLEELKSPPAATGRW